MFVVSIAQSVRVPFMARAHIEECRLNILSVHSLRGHAHLRVPACAHVRVHMHVFVRVHLAQV